MGSTICHQQQIPIPKSVTFLPNSLSSDQKYKVYDSQSLRFCDILATKSERNQYLFTMKMRNQIDIRECIPVLNEIVHCTGYENYELKLQSKMIIDIFDSKLSSTMLDVRNEKNLSEFSMKIIPFKSYNSIEFKKAFYQLYLNKQLGMRSSTVRLLDYYIYGLNSQQQVFIFLFQKCITSLANIAEYRKQGNIHWSFSQKIKIIYEILSSYQNLFNRNIIHRDLRPNNIFYVAQTGKFAIGNFSRGRLLRRNYEHDRMSVCGVPDFSCRQMQMLMLQGSDVQHLLLQVGFYEGINQDYCGIMSLLNIIETCQIYDNSPIFKQPQMSNIVNMINRQAEIRIILAQIQRIASSAKINLQTQIGDQSIAESCSYLLAHTHKNIIEQYLFEAYGYLGYLKDYEEKAQKVLEKNNQVNSEYKNAPILRNLGDFYSGQNGNGIQFYYNSFLLYILRADKQIKYGWPDKAEVDLDHAKEIYFKFNKVIQSELQRIQINRISALIFLEENDLQNSIRIINDTFVKAAENNIPVEKQCNILLAYAKIYKRVPSAKADALKKLTIGLSICQNVGTFQSVALSKIYKSKFMKEIANTYLDNIKLQPEPRKKQQTIEQRKLIQQTETYLKSALQIEEKQSVDDLQIAETLQYLSKLYYLQHNFNDCKRYCDATKIRYAHMKQLIHPIKQVNVLYMRGSCCYYLKQLHQAKIDYQTCLAGLERLPQTQEKQILGYNIQGNLGLVFMQMGDSNGKAMIERALEQIKQLKGEQSYDYATMYQHYINDTHR